MIRACALQVLLLGAAAALSILPAAAQDARPDVQPVTKADAKSDAIPDSEGRLFAVEIRTGPKWDASLSPQQQAYFREHSANLRLLREAGRLVLGARYADKRLVILAATSAEQARALMDQDPAIMHGTFVYELNEFNVFYAGNVPARARR